MIRASNSFSNPRGFRHIKYDENETFIIEYNGKTIDDKGWFDYKGEIEILETLDFNKTLEIVEIDKNNKTFNCILNYYRLVAFEVKEKFHNKLREGNLKVIKRMRLDEYFDFIIHTDLQFGNTDNIEMYLRNGFASLKLGLEFYRDNYDRSVIVESYLESFIPLIERLGYNQAMINGVNKYPLFTEVPKDFESVNLCYNLIQDRFRVRTFYPDTGEWPGAVDNPDDFYVVVGFVPISYVWNDFKEGNRDYMYFVELYLSSLAHLAKVISNKVSAVKPLMYLNKKTIPREVGIDPDSLLDLVKIRSEFDSIEDIYYNKGEVSVGSHKMLVNSLESLLNRNEFVQKCINNKNMNTEFNKLLRAFKLEEN